MNKKSKNLTVIAASENYLAGVNALINSLDYWKIDTDILLLSFRLPKEYLEKIQEVFDFNFHIIESTGEHQVLSTAIERFKYAVEIGKEYESILLLDADMYFMSDEANVLFDAARKGLIITASNGMIINFNKAHQDRYGVNLGSDEYPYAKVHTTAPIWLNPQDLDWFEALYDAKRIDSFDDFLFLNILGIKMGKDKKMICLPPYRMTNIHHTCLKPVIGTIDKEVIILSGTEESMICMHGKFWDENYVKDLMKVMEGYFRNQQFGERQQQQAQNSCDLLLREFIKYCYNCKLSLKDFVKIDWLEEKL